MINLPLASSPGVVNPVLAGSAAAAGGDNTFQVYSPAGVGPKTLAVLDLSPNLTVQTNFTNWSQIRNQLIAVIVRPGSAWAAPRTITATFFVAGARISFTSRAQLLATDALCFEADLSSLYSGLALTCVLTTDLANTEILAAVVLLNKSAPSLPSPTSGLTINDLAALIHMMSPAFTSYLPARKTLEELGGSTGSFFTPNLFNTNLVAPPNNTVIAKTASGKYDVKLDGIYMISYNVMFITATNKYCKVRVLLNGIELPSSYSETYIAAGKSGAVGATRPWGNDHPLGDPTLAQLEFQIGTDSGTTVNVEANSFFAITCLTLPKTGW